MVGSVLLLPLLLAAAPQGHLIVVERFETQGAQPEDAAKVREAVVHSLAGQGYQVVKVEEREAQAKDAKAQQALGTIKGADLILSAMVTRAGASTRVDAVLARLENRTLLGAAKVMCTDDLPACGTEAGEQLGARLREQTGVRVKVKAPPR